MPLKIYKVKITDKTFEVLHSLRNGTQVFVNDGIYVIVFTEEQLIAFEKAIHTDDIISAGIIRVEFYKTEKGTM